MKANEEISNKKQTKSQTPELRQKAKAKASDSKVGRKTPASPRRPKATPINNTSNQDHNYFYLIEALMSLTFTFAFLFLLGSSLSWLERYNILWNFDQFDWKMLVPIGLAVVTVVLAGNSLRTLFLAFIKGEIRSGFLWLWKFRNRIILLALSLGVFLIFLLVKIDMGQHIATEEPVIADEENLMEEPKADTSNIAQDVIATEDNIEAETDSDDTNVQEGATDPQDVVVELSDNESLLDPEVQVQADEAVSSPSESDTASAGENVLIVDSDLQSDPSSINSPKEDVPSNTSSNASSKKTDQKSSVLEYPAYGLRLAKVAGGSFDMGSNSGVKDEVPIHRVTVGGFSISKFEITNVQFVAFLNEKGNQTEDGVKWINLSGNDEGEKCKINKRFGLFAVAPRYEDHPVNYVSWAGARAYCAWLSSKIGREVRLPTEAEWEFAARGGNKSRGYIYSGSNTIEQVAWYDENSGSSVHKVGTKSPNELGIYDMSGNVYEWCSDWYNKNYYSNSSSRNPKGPSFGSRRVIRGGSWHYVDGACRTANRDDLNPDGRKKFSGFRVVLPQ